MRLTICFAAVGLAVAAPLAQAAEQGVLYKVPLTIGDQLEIRLNGVGASSSWIVGAVIGDPPSVAVGAGTLAASHGPARRRRLSGITNGRVSTEAGVFTLNLKRAASMGHLALVTAPKHTRLRFVVDGNVVQDTLLTSTVLVKDGVLLDEAVKGLRTLFLRLQSDKLPAPPRIARLPTGRYVVSKDAMRENLRAWGEFPPVGRPECDCMRRAAFSLGIGSNGRVTTVRALSGDGDIVGSVTQTLPNWTFSPFTEDGLPVAVEGLITVLVDRQGTIRLLW